MNDPSGDFRRRFDVNDDELSLAGVDNGEVDCVEGQFSAVVSHEELANAIDDGLLEESVEVDSHREAARVV